MTQTLRHDPLHHRLHVPGIAVRWRPQREPEAVVSLGLTPVVVGSGSECELNVTGTGVSRRHCELSLDEQGVRIRDLGSKNGTRVAGVPVKEAMVPFGATIEVGSEKLDWIQRGDDRLVELSRSNRFGDALGLSLSMRALFARLSKVAKAQDPVLLIGESGTGKEVLARGIHQEGSQPEGPFVVVDCAALSVELAEAELFGYQRGAFSGAEASREGLVAKAEGGTLFLDEIGELPLALQPKLLRLMEEQTFRPVGADQYRSVKLRVVAATHRNLRLLASTKKFREDLYFRLAVLEVRVPPLRERKDDIPLLAESFLASRSPALGFDALPGHALELLQAHSWPGNVRELKNTLARMVVDPAVGLERLDAPSVPLEPTLLGMPLYEAKELSAKAFERDFLSQRMALAGLDPDVDEIARKLGVTARSLVGLLKKHGLPVPHE